MDESLGGLKYRAPNGANNDANNHDRYHHHLQDHYLHHRHFQRSRHHNFGETINSGPPRPWAWGWRYNHPPSLPEPARQHRHHPKFSLCYIPSCHNIHHTWDIITPLSSAECARQHRHHPPEDLIIPKHTMHIAQQRRLEEMQLYNIYKS